MTNRQLEEKLRGAFDRAAPNRFEDLPTSAPSEKGSVEIMKTTKNNRHIARFAALAATLVLVIGVGFGVRSNFRPEMPTFSADTGNANLPAEPENAAPVAPAPETPAVPESSEQLEAPTAPVTPGIPETPALPAAPMIPETPAVPDAPITPVAPPVPEDPAADALVAAALELAFTDAGVEESEVEAVNVRNVDKQTGIVELDFWTSEVQYRYRVNVAAVVADQVHRILSGSTAMEIAFSHAGVDAINTKVMQMLLDDLAEPMHYDYTFRSGDYEYVYEIDAATGAVLKAEKEEFEYSAAEPQLPTIPSKPAVENPGATLTTNEVIEIACGHAGVPRDQIGPMELTMDDDEAVRHYDLKFQYDGAVYFYEISASDGEILTWQKSASSGTEFATPPETPYPPTPALPVQPTPVPMPVEPQPLTGVVPQDRAVQIALEHAGLTAEAVRDLTVELDLSDNLGHYRIAFKTDTTEYIYKIHYGAGVIMEWTEADIG